jgi:hypothetical protein
MKFQPLSFTIPVLVLAGIFFSIWGYFIGGMPKAVEHAVVWYAASIVAVLLGLWVRRSSQAKK